MDKLSSILPTSPRVQSVDLTESAPVRPGAPTFGRTVGVSTVKDRFSVSQQAKDVAFKDTLASVNPKEAKGVKIVEDMAKKFFEARVAPDVKTGPASEQTQARQLDIEQDLPRAAAAVKVDTPAVANEKEAGPQGRRLDVEA